MGSQFTEAHNYCSYVTHVLDLWTVGSIPSNLRERVVTLGIFQTEIGAFRSPLFTVLFT